MLDFLFSEAVTAKIGAALVAALMLIVSWRVIGRMASRFLRFWRALPLLGKVVLPVCLTVFYLHGSTKQKGAPKADGASAVSPSQNVVADDMDVNVAERSLEEALLPKYPETKYKNIRAQYLDEQICYYATNDETVEDIRAVIVGEK